MFCVLLGIAAHFMNYEEIRNSKSEHDFERIIAKFSIWALVSVAVIIIIYGFIFKALTAHVSFENFWEKFSATRFMLF